MADKKKSLDELDYGSQEWFDAFDALPYADQVSLINQSRDETAAEGEGFADFGVGSGLGLPGTGYTLPDVLGGQGGAQLDPRFQALLQFGGGAAMPTYTSAGKLDPYDLPQEAARNNLVQDQATSLADVILSSLAGPGALDPSTFAPIETAPTDRIATPGLTQLDRYARAGGYKGYIAQKMRDGATDDEAIADLYNFISAEEKPNDPPDVRATRQAIIDSLPTAYGGSDTKISPPSGRGQQTQRSAGTAGQSIRDLYDETGITKWANDLYMKVADDQANVAAGWTDPKTGFSYTKGPSYEESPIAKKFSSLGLPTPFAAYDDPQYLNMAYDTMAPNLGAETAGQTATNAQLQKTTDQAQAEFRDIGDRNIDMQKAYRDLYVQPGEQVTVNPENQLNNLASAMSRMVPPQQTGGVPQQPASAAAAAAPLPTQAGGRVGAPQQYQPPLPTPPAFTPADVTASGDAYNRAFGLAAMMMRPQTIEPGQPRNPAVNKSVIANPAGGYDFQDSLGGAQAHAFMNQFANFIPMNGKGRGTKVERVNPTTAKASQTASDTARKKYTDAYNTQYRAGQSITPEQIQAINAYGNASFQARQGRTPYVDAITQRLLGQRAVGLRGL